MYWLYYAEGLAAKVEAAAGEEGEKGKEPPNAAAAKRQQGRKEGGKEAR
jgi:hypothetical protein